MLDGAAIRAAQASTYSQPTDDGIPVARDYLIDYIFQLR